MRIGDLNRRITLQYETRTADGMGGATVTWTTKADVWAAIWPVSANETMQAAQQIMTITHRIRIRYRPDLRYTWRIKYGERYFSIVSVINPSENGVMLDLLCREASA